MTVIIIMSSYKNYLTYPLYLSTWHSIIILIIIPWIDPRRASYVWDQWLLVKWTPSSPHGSSTFIDRWMDDHHDDNDNDEDSNGGDDSDDDDDDNV